MNLFELAAVLTLDKSGYEQGLNDAESSASSFGSKLKSGLATAAKATVAAVGAASTAVGALAKQSLDAYGSYEQLVGGVETLFGVGGKSVEEYAKEQGKAVSEVKDEYNSLLKTQESVLSSADKAYKTAGMSANEYMETVTSFSASLIQSTGRGEQQDLDELENNLDAQLKETKRTLEDEYKARQDAWKKQIAEAKKNKSGNVEILQQQRDEELKALKRANEDKLEAMKIANKEQLKAAEASNNASTKTADSMKRAAELADLAIVDMSDNANKMGTDMEAIQNAYQGFAKANYTMLDNLKLGYGGTKEEMQRLLADAEKLTGKKYNLSSYADIVEAIHAVQTEMGITGTTAKEASSTIEGSVGSMKAAWENLKVGIADENADISGLSKELADSVSTAAGNILPRFQQILLGMGTVIQDLAPIISEQLPLMIEQVVPGLLTAGGELLNGLLNGIIAALPALGETTLTIVSMIGENLAANAPTIIQNGTDLITTLLTGLVSALPQIGQAAINIITTLADSLSKQLPALIPAAVQAIVELATTLTSPDNLSNLVNSAIILVTSLADGIVNAIPILIDALPTIIENLIKGFAENAPKLLAVGPTLMIQLGTALIKAIPQLLSHLPEIIGAIVEGFGTFGGEIMSIGENIVKGVWDGISGMFGWIGDQVSGFFGGIVDNVKSFLGIASPSKVFAEIGEYMAAGVGVGFDDEFEGIRKDIDDQMDFSSSSSVDLTRNIKTYDSGIVGGGTNGGFTSTQNAAAATQKQPAVIIVQLQSGLELARALIDDINNAKRIDGIAY